MRELGIGEDGELLEIERVNEACWLVHAEGNEMSPFEFSVEAEAKQFVGMLGRNRMSNRLEGMMSMRGNGDE